MTAATDGSSFMRRWAVARGGALLLAAAALALKLFGSGDTKTTTLKGAEVAFVALFSYLIMRRWVAATRDGRFPRRLLDVFPAGLVFAGSALWIALVSIPSVMLPRSDAPAELLPIAILITVPVLLLAGRAAWELMNPPDTGSAPAAPSELSTHIEFASAVFALVLMLVCVAFFGSELWAEVVRHGVTRPLIWAPRLVITVACVPVVAAAARALITRDFSSPLLGGRARRGPPG